MTQLSSIPILCFGEALWDHLPSGKRAGGAPMNVALHLKKLGQQVSFASRVGRDVLGAELISFLRASGMDLALIQQDEKLHTGEVKVKLDKYDSPRYDILENVAWDNIQLTDALVSAFAHAQVIVYGTLASRANTTKNSLLKLLDTPALKVADANLRMPYIDREVVDALLSRADIIKLNEEELHLLSKWINISGTEEVCIREIAKRYDSGGFILTKGKDGAVFFDKDTFISRPGYKVDIVDAVGAGDAFLSGFLVKLLQEKDPFQALSYGNALGAFVATKEGGTPEHDAQAINDLLKGRA